MGVAGERRLVRLGSRQCAVVTVRDIVSCEVPRTVVYRRLETREWIRLHPGVFKLGSSAATVDELEMGALLAAGGGGGPSPPSGGGRAGVGVAPGGEGPGPNTGSAGR